MDSDLGTQRSVGININVVVGTVHIGISIYGWWCDWQRLVVNEYRVYICAAIRSDIWQLGVRILFDRRSIYGGSVGRCWRSCVCVKQLWSELDLYHDKRRSIDCGDIVVVWSVYVCDRPRQCGQQRLDLRIVELRRFI